jgi:hypothetical protein
MRIVANSHIWNVAGNGLITAIWKNTDGTTTPVHFYVNNAGDDIILSGNPSPPSSGWKEVVCSPSFDAVNF